VVHLLAAACMQQSPSTATQPHMLLVRLMLLFTAWIHRQTHATTPSQADVSMHLSTLVHLLGRRTDARQLHPGAYR
jgi:hypothetical protein